MSCLPKPVLRGHIKRYGLRTLFGAVAFATFNCCMFNFFHRLPKIKAKEEFFKTYDPKAHSLDLINWGYLSSVRPEDLRPSDD